MNFAGLRLEQHLRYTGCACGVSVKREDITFRSGNTTARVGKK
jgi:hypothetical protein